MRTTATSRRVYALAVGVVIALVYVFSFHGDSETISRDFHRYYEGIHVPDWIPGAHNAGDEEVLDRLGRLKDDVVKEAVKVDAEDMKEVPETKVLVHVVGYTIFDRLYMHNGTVYIVASNASSIPDLKFITSSGVAIFNGPEEDKKRLPNDQIMRIITPLEAFSLFGGQLNEDSSQAPLYPPPTVFHGFSYILNEDKQFVSHYFHFTAELLFGLWRAYSSLDPHIPPSGLTTLSEPQRMQFVHTEYAHFRDGPRINPFVLRAIYPTISLEFKDDWNERAKSGAVHVWERALYVDRAATRLGAHYQKTRRPASEAMILPGSEYWWETVRTRVLRYCGLNKDWIFGRSGEDTRSEPGALTLKDPERMVVTYISRQGGDRRKLKDADHEVLVEELEKLRDQYGYEVNIVDMKDYTLAEQFRLAGRTTIMLGVHGNGLTSLVWMRPTPRATVIEFFAPGGFAADYWYTATSLGMAHYGVWGDQIWTGADTPPGSHYPANFQGTNIPLDGRAVAQLVHRRLQLRDADADAGDDA